LVDLSDRSALARETWSAALLTGAHDATDGALRLSLLPDKLLLNIGHRTRALTANVNRQWLLVVEYPTEIKPTAARFAFPKTLRLAHDQDPSRRPNQ
jgi:hypothetical protein